MLREGEDGVTLEVVCHFVHKKPCCPKFSEHLHELNGADILQLLGRVLWNRIQPFQFPRGRNLPILLDGRQALIRLLRNHLRFPMLKTLTLSSRGTSGGASLLRFH